MEERIIFLKRSSVFCILLLCLFSCQTVKYATLEEKIDLQRPVFEKQITYYNVIFKEDKEKGVIFLDYENYRNLEKNIKIMHEREQILIKIVNYYNEVLDGILKGDEKNEGRDGKPRAISRGKIQ